MGTYTEVWHGHHSHPKVRIGTTRMCMILTHCRGNPNCASVVACWSGLQMLVCELLCTRLLRGRGGLYPARRDWSIGMLEQIPDVGVRVFHPLLLQGKVGSHPEG